MELATSDAQLQPGTGNGLLPESMFGGDAFSAAPRSTPQLPPSPAYPGSSPVLSSIGTPKSGAPEPSAKEDPFAALPSTYRSPSTGSLPHQTQPAPRPNQQTSQVTPSFSSSGMGVEVWRHADCGFLSWQEFYNALKLVTVAQSKRELTPEIVKMAIYGPASAKIPPPQINLSAVPAPRVNAGGAAQPTQVGGISSVPSPQSAGFGGPLPPNAGMHPQHLPSQSAPMPLPSVRTPSAQGVYAEGYPRGPTPPNTSVSNDWLGVVSARPVTGQALSKETAPAMVPVPTDDAKLQPGSGNGLLPDSMFGGDAFSAAPRSTPQQPPSAAYPGSSPILSSSGTPKSGAPEPSAKADPFAALASTYTLPSIGSLPHQTQPAPRPNQQTSQVTPSFSSSGMGVEVESKEILVLDHKERSEMHEVSFSFNESFPQQSKAGTDPNASIPDYYDGRGRGGRGNNESDVGSIVVSDGKGPVGLVNVLNITCYFNVIIQLLLSLKVVLEDFLAKKAGNLIDDVAFDKVKECLDRISLHPTGKLPCKAHEKLVCGFLDDKRYPEFTRRWGGYTTDSLRGLLNKIPDTIWVSETFEIQETCMCLGCGKTSRAKSTFHTTLKPTSDWQFMENLLSSSFLKKCSACRRYTNWKWTFESLPPVIIMRNEDNYIKIRIVEEIDMGRYHLSDNQPAIYELKAVILYQCNNRRDTVDGHFFAFVKREDEWYEVDDQWVSKTTWNELKQWKRGAPVMWAYERRGY